MKKNLLTIKQVMVGIITIASFSLYYDVSGKQKSLDEEKQAEQSSRSEEVKASKMQDEGSTASEQNGKPSGLQSTFNNTISKIKSFFTPSKPTQAELDKKAQYKTDVATLQDSVHATHNDPIQQRVLLEKLARKQKFEGNDPYLYNLLKLSEPSTPARPATGVTTASPVHPSMKAPARPSTSAPETSPALLSTPVSKPSSVPDLEVKPPVVGALKDIEQPKDLETDTHSPLNYSEEEEQVSGEPLPKQQLPKPQPQEAKSALAPYQTEEPAALKPLNVGSQKKPANTPVFQTSP